MIQENTMLLLTELSPWLLPGPILILVMLIKKIAFSKDGGRTFTDIDFAQGVWDYKDIDNYI